MRGRHSPTLITKQRAVLEHYLQRSGIVENRTLFRRTNRPLLAIELQYHGAGLRPAFYTNPEGTLRSGSVRMSKNQAS